MVPRERRAPPESRRSLSASYLSSLPIATNLVREAVWRGAAGGGGKRKCVVLAREDRTGRRGAPADERRSG